MEILPIALPNKPIEQKRNRRVYQYLIYRGVEKRKISRYIIERRKTDRRR